MYKHVFGLTQCNHIIDECSKHQGTITNAKGRAAGVAEVKQWLAHTALCGIQSGLCDCGLTAALRARGE
jgi:hypothetical protein